MTGRVVVSGHSDTYGRNPAGLFHSAEEPQVARKDIKGAR